MAVRQEAPRMYRSRIGPLWWTRNRRYFLYFWRELTGPVMAAWLFVLLWGLVGVARGNPSAARVLVASPGFLTLSAVALAFSLLHSITWPVLLGWVGMPAPGGKLATGPKVAIPFVVLWIIASLLLWFLLFRGF